MNLADICSFPADSVYQTFNVDTQYE